MVNGSFLEWKVSDTSGDDLGIRLLEQNDLNLHQTLTGLPSFETVLTDSSGGKLNATLTFNVTSEYQNYTILCNTFDNDYLDTIDIPGIDKSVIGNSVII